MRFLLRVPVLIVALIFGATTSQLPEFTQQYAQRLGGAVDELETFVRQFEEDARAAGLTREAALAEYKSTDSMFLGRRGDTVLGTIRRYETLRRLRAELTASGPVERVFGVALEPQMDIAASAWEEYRPAVPLTPEGFLFAMAGFLAAVAGFFGASRLARIVSARLRTSRQQG